MPQFLTTAGTSHIIEDIIIRAKSELVLITPYLKLNRILFERLTDANHRGVRIQLVYGKSELKANERRQLDALTNIELLFLENLHAKCYFNESTLIVSSMNLYEFSEKNNREMGIVLTRRDDGDCFADALAEAQSIINAARGRTSSTQPAHTVVPTLPDAVVSLVPKKNEYDETIMVQKVFEMLKQLEGGEQLSIETVPSSWQEGKFTSTITAQDYPRKGINFRFVSAFRFDFISSEDYKSVKSAQQDEVRRSLDSKYRCFWNRDVIQIYAAINHKNIDEDTTAAYFVKAIEGVAGVLRSLPLTLHNVS